MAVKPVPSLICCRQEVPGAAMTTGVVPCCFMAFLTAGNNTISPMARLVW